MSDKHLDGSKVSTRDEGEESFDASLDRIERARESLKERRRSKSVGREMITTTTSGKMNTINETPLQVPAGHLAPEASKEEALVAGHGKGTKTIVMNQKSKPKRGGLTGPIDSESADSDQDASASHSLEISTSGGSSPHTTNPEILPNNKS
ncbi:hypothetical protein GE061_009198 [Apolygus lucorum]|uniref:Uncharacterized protein n=1 Tax=Apolygus lucorum TaxID=248454 RepID=A0A6A4K4B0_APOLU|nr:hypothetical protein GE061_009198 [Apolygus lucorum]